MEIGEMEEQEVEQFWRDADGADVMRVMDGQGVQARFRDRTDRSWKHGLLSGWSKIDKPDDLQWASSEGTFWRFCQVYDPPEILKNKPDPGKGWRLLEKFPPEELQEGDETWGNYQDNEWGKSDYAERGCRHQSGKLWYRRRIDNNPVIPNSCRSRDTIPSGWRLLGKDEERLASDLYWSQGCKEWLLIGDDRVAIANELPRWYAIRQIVVADFFLLEGYDYSMPGGQTIRITAKGFEVL
jgi:hypothetical protein